MRYIANAATIEADDTVTDVRSHYTPQDMRAHYAPQELIATAREPERERAPLAFGEIAPEDAGNFHMICEIRRRGYPNQPDAKPRPLVEPIRELPPFECRNRVAFTERWIDREGVRNLALTLNETFRRNGVDISEYENGIVLPRIPPVFWWVVIGAWVVAIGASILLG